MFVPGRLLPGRKFVNKSILFCEQFVNSHRTFVPSSDEGVPLPRRDCRWVPCQITTRAALCCEGAVAWELRYANELRLGAGPGSPAPALVTCQNLTRAGATTCRLHLSRFDKSWSYVPSVHNLFTFYLQKKLEFF